MRVNVIGLCSYIYDLSRRKMKLYQLWVGDPWSHCAWLVTSQKGPSEPVFVPPVQYLILTHRRHVNWSAVVSSHGHAERCAA